MEESTQDGEGVRARILALLRVFNKELENYAP